MTDMGDLHYFLGIRVQRTTRGFFLNQAQYAEELLRRAGMSQCHAASTPVDMAPKVAAAAGAPVSDLSECRSLTGGLQYLTMTRPDLAYAVQQACLHMHDPRDSHRALIKRILRYVRGTLQHGLLLLLASSSTYIIAYSDADWAGCPDTRRSTSGYCVYLGDTLVSWSSKSDKSSSLDPVQKQNTAPWRMRSLIVYG